MIHLIIQGENLDSDLWWLNPVTATFERCYLPKGIAVEEPSLSLWCYYVVGADMGIAVVCH